MKKTSLLISDQSLKSSSLYVGYLILSELMKVDQISTLDLHSILKNKYTNFTYSGVLYALVFLYMNGLVDFDEPYVYKTKI